MDIFDLIPYLYPIGGVFIAVAIVGSIVVPLMRRKSLRRVAASLGFSFDAYPTQTTTDLLNSFTMIQSDASHKIRNVMEGDLDGTYVVIGDYSYTNRTHGHGGNRNASASRQTFAVFRSDDLPAPEFCLRPKSSLSRMLEGLVSQISGQDDIDVPSHPVFSETYRLSGSDEAAIRARFHTGILEYFEAHPGLRVEVTAHALLFYRPGNSSSSKFAKPGEIQALLDDALEVLHIFLPDES